MATPFALSLVDAEDLVVGAGLSDHDVLVKSLPLLVGRGIERELVVALRQAWVGSTKPISARWAAAIGMSRVRSVDAFANATRRSLAVVRARLNRSSIHALPSGSAPEEQVDLAKEVWEVAEEFGLKDAACVCAIRPQEAALYRRRMARVLAELAHEGVPATDAAVARHWREYALTPENLKKPWTSSPATMWSLLPVQPETAADE